MKLKKIFPYNIKKALPVLGLAGASFFMGGCDKNDEPVLQREEELRFSKDDFSAISYIDENKQHHVSDIAKDYAKDDNIKKVYLVAEGNWFLCADLPGLRKLILEPVFNLSPKFVGKGDFNFKSGLPSITPEDSIWLVQKGFTVNKYRTNKIRSY